MEMRDRLKDLITKTHLSVHSGHLAEMLIANGVILPPCKVGDPVWFLLEDDFPVRRWFLSEEKVTDVSTRGFL